MGFKTRGFLGTEAQRLVDEQQKNYPDLFEFTYGCSETAMKVASLPFSSEPPENVRALVGVMFSRCVAQFQGGAQPSHNKVISGDVTT